MDIVRLAARSLYNRRYTAWLTLLSIALGVALMLGVEKVRLGAKTSFANTLSGADLIVGARSGAIPLLLYSVFRIGNATNNIDWQSYQAIAHYPAVRWTIPLSLGDSHRGFRVLGTNRDYFEHYRYARQRPLEFSAGQPFDDVYDAVLGADVADKLGYRLGQSIVLSHGIDSAGLAKHDDRPFRVVGILKRTGTPVDRTVHISLAGIEAIHVDWQSGARIPGAAVSAEQARAMDLTPRTLTAFLIGLDSKRHVFSMQRAINEYRPEPLLAILPGVTLQELWDMMSVAENALLGVSVGVVVSSLLGLLTVILAGLHERRREMAILRSVGATPWHIVTLLVTEATLLASCGVLCGVGLLYLLLWIAQPVIESHWGLYIVIAPPTGREFILMALTVGAGCLAGLLPAWLAYRYSLADGMTVRV
ncbi:MAG: ABC transporter permease [Gammaproteobacteria bacterium]|nr:ABC transporter permease [Gammaproteobacteria bacterium]MCP5426066.1 ABC transporter permease [Gammaproteobacteria bacterium]